MNSEVKKRKKRFWVFCLTCALMFGNVLSMSVLAETYTLSGDSAPSTITPNTDIFKPNDVICYVHNSYCAPTSSIIYYDADGALELNRQENDALSERDSNAEFTVIGYAGEQIDAEAFKGWTIKDTITGSGGALGTIKLQAAAYRKSTITYHLDGGTNDPSNPDVYYEGKEEISLADASKSGYRFDGWYMDHGNALTPVTVIPVTQTGNVDLYAQFTRTSDYDILDGANSRWLHGSTEDLTFRGSGEFSKFTGVKVDGEVVDAGNYTASEGSTVVTLKAAYLDTLAIKKHDIELLWDDGSAKTKFTIYTKSSGHKDDDDDKNDTPAETNTVTANVPQKDAVPKTGDRTPFAWLLVLTGLSGAGMVLAGKKGKKS